MSRYKSDPEIAEYESTTCCTSFLHYSWKTITCLFSHATLVCLVVSYCVLGAFTFEALEVENERMVKSGIYKIRENITLQLWNYTQQMGALDETNFTIGAFKYLKEFENSLLDKMNKEGWDGEEDPNKVQWTRTGSLFYSIIVITTIGYGHIAPKTPWGKVVTIFYAILGIPLMLLCLSTIGDVMANSFKFLYWRVCCYMCQKNPKNLKRSKSLRGPSRLDSSKINRSRNGSFRRYTRTPKANKHLADTVHISHSDTELRYLDESYPKSFTLPKRKSMRAQRNMEKERKISRTSTVSNQLQHNNVLASRGQSLDRRRTPKEFQLDIDPVLIDKTSILFNKYVVGKDGGFDRTIPGKGITPRSIGSHKRSCSMPPRRERSLPRYRHFLEPPKNVSDSSDVEDIDDDHDSVIERPKSALPPRRGVSPKRGPSPRRRSRSPNHTPSPSPKMMTPIGYGLRHRYVEDDSDVDYYDGDTYDIAKSRTKPVPIWLCVLLVVSYILAGAYLFMTWEGWEYLDAAYFCFITLTTIGFGDLVPAKEVSTDNERVMISIALCSLYLLFGISLLAMSFNLVQEEVITNVKSIAKSLGIIKRDSEDEDEV